jgi:hypothetical protein
MEGLSMNFISNMEELEENLKRLERYRYSDDQSEQKYYLNRIKLGTCFVVFQGKGKLLLGPSRFLGYRNNTIALHMQNDEKDGRKTNPVITKILQIPPKYNEHLENLYREHCQQLGFTANPKGTRGVTKKYWLVSI